MIWNIILKITYEISIYAWIHFWIFLFCYAFLAVHMLVPHFFSYRDFNSIFNNLGRASHPSLFLSFKIFITIFACLFFYMSFGINLAPDKNTSMFLSGSPWLNKLCKVNWHIYTTESSYLRIRDVFFIYLIYNGFQEFLRSFPPISFVYFLWCLFLFSFFHWKGIFSSHSQLLCVYRKAIDFLYFKLI